MILLYCGIRRGELVALTWRDVDLQQRYLDINKAVYFDANTPIVKPPETKTSIRKVPIPNRIFDMLCEAKKNATSMMVCPSTTGAMMTQEAFKRAWQSYMHFLDLAAGERDRSRSNPKVIAVDKLTPHMFRHTYATMLYDAGVDVKSAQRFLGHADVVTTLRVYTHLSADKEQEAIDTLNRHFDKSPIKRKQVDAPEL